MSLFSLIFGSKTQNDALKLLNAREFKEAVTNKKVQLIDVRTYDEFKSGHIKNAKNIDFYSGKFNVEFNKLNKENPIYLYCRSGARSRQTSNKLAAMGFKQIFDLRGGFSNYN